VPAKNKGRQEKRLLPQTQMQEEVGKSQKVPERQLEMLAMKAVQCFPERGGSRILVGGTWPGFSKVSEARETLEWTFPCLSLGALDRIISDHLI
jgi:hypothetical protein